MKISSLTRAPSLRLAGLFLLLAPLGLQAQQPEFLQVPQPLANSADEMSRFDDPALVDLSQRAFMSAMQARAERLGKAGAADDLIIQAMSDPAPKRAEGSATVQAIGGTSDEPTGEIDLPVDPNLSCPGFYVVRAHAGQDSRPGRFGIELGLNSGRRILAGGLNFGGRASSSVGGFSAFNIANARNENQTVDIGISVGAAGRLRLQRRSGGQVVATPVDRAVPAGDSTVSVVVPPGFYVVGYTPDNSPSARFAVSALTSFTNRAGGGFQGGVVAGGYHDPSRAAGTTRTTGFAGFCIFEPQRVDVSVLSAPTYGSSGARGMAFSLSSNSGEKFLESRTIQTNPEVFLSDGIDRIADYPGILTNLDLFVPNDSRTRVRQQLGLTETDLDLLLDFVLIGVVSDLGDDQRRALATQVNRGDTFLAQLRALVSNGLFVWLDPAAIGAIPLDDPDTAERETLQPLVDALLLELEDQGLNDIAQAISNVQPLRLTGFEGALDPADLVPGPAVAAELSASLQTFLLASSDVRFLESTANGDWVRTVASTVDLVDFLFQLYADFGIVDEQDVPITEQEIRDLIAEAGLSEVVFADFRILNGAVDRLFIELASLDATLGLSPGDAWLGVIIESFSDSLGPLEDAVLFDLCRLPPDVFECSP
ncbi:MAG: hypothetical protein RQ729_01030 [Wenzhouxiangellaceae bacterium]|nr:hypothetical protein [Wenzhouxiangellaceae bacterium]